MDNDDISKLLRLKRYEHPPEDYFENFLAEFQLRQRAEVIHRPFYRIAWDRLCHILPPQNLPQLAMAGSFAIAVIACGSVLTWSDSGDSLVAKTSPASSPVGKASQPPPSVQYVLPAEVVTYASARRSF